MRIGFRSHVLQVEEVSQVYLLSLQVVIMAYFTGSKFVLTLCVAFRIRITVEFAVTLWGSYLEDKFTIEFIELVYGPNLRVVVSGGNFVSSLLANFSCRVYGSSSLV